MNKGTITPALIVVTGTFLVVIYGLLFVLNLQLDFSHRQVASEQALHIAESGANYYRWHLAHDPTDYQDGTGSAGPYEHEYVDPQGSALGRYSLEIIAPGAGSSVTTIRSTGWTYQYPNVRRTISVQYGQPSLATYSFLQNASSWYGDNITVNGLIHSNNGIRMDGTNLSLVTSSQETYVCGTETGCTSRSDCQDPPESDYCTWNSVQSRCECEGVWGEGGDQGLWQFPVPPVDFNSISFDFANMRDQAQSEGVYLGPSGSWGYHIDFRSDGSVRIYRITSMNYIRGHDSSDNCQNRYQIIQNQTLLGTYDLDDAPIIFAEDNVWLEGDVNGRSTVVAARFPIETNNMNVWIVDNIEYEDLDGSHSLGVIAQNDIIFARNVPEDFRIDAALMAQGGRIMRHAYVLGCGIDASHSIKDTLTINGTVISFEKAGWNWNNSGGSLISGFTTREITYDPNLLYYPPPYFPTTGEYEFINWVEE